MTRPIGSTVRRLGVWPVVDARVAACRHGASYLGDDLGRQVLGFLAAGEEVGLRLDPQAPAVAARRLSGNRSARTSRTYWALSADNLTAVLTDAGMTLSDLVNLRIYTTDVEEQNPRTG